jgi:hypothetical protein
MLSIVCRTDTSCNCRFIKLQLVHAIYTTDVICNTAGSTVLHTHNSVLDNNEVKDALAQHIVKGEHILRDALAGMEASYNTTLWWGPASDAVNNYMEHGSILARSGVSRMASTAAAEQCNATIASDGSTSIAVDASSDIQQAAAGVGAFSTALSQFPMFSNMVSHIAYITHAVFHYH